MKATNSKMNNTLDRRSFIKLSASASGALIAGVCLQSCISGETTAVEYTFSPLITIDTKGWVTLIAKNPEIGQGIKTSLPMILAEALGADWEKVRVIQGDFNKAYEEQWAGGSYAIILNWDLMRTAAGKVRHVLIEAGSKVLQRPVVELTTVNGKVVHASSGESVPFEKLLVEASKIGFPENVEPKALDTFEIVGRDIKQVDIVEMVNGTAVFGIDIQLPNMVYATVRKNPVFEGGIGSCDPTTTLTRPGVIDVVELNNKNYGGRLLAPNSPNFVNGYAVVANSTWAAFKGAEELSINWDNTDTRKENSASILKRFYAQLNHTTIEREDGDITAVKRMAATNFEAIYEVPFLAHVTMEPMNCTVDFKNGHCEVWAPTQNPEALQNGLVKLFGLLPEQITIHMPRIGGAFGRRYYVDYAMDAAILSKKVGKPVKLSWTREDDIKHDWYRPASVQKLVASLDASGKISGWQHILANASRKTSLGREGGPAGTEIDKYEFPAGFLPDLRLEYGHVLSDVPLGQWRAVGHSATAFAIHSFFCELAYLNKMDHIAYFLQFLGPERMVPVVDDYEFDLGRFLKVIHKVRQISHWETSLPKGQGRGFAAGKHSGTFIAEVVTVAVREDGNIDILKVDAVVDCGLVINPSGARAQVEGGILEGLCAALYGEITVEDGAAVQSNFHDYRWMRIGETPELNIEFINNGLPPRGLGEPPLPPAAPALANAIFAASGKRIRKLPILK